MINNEWSGPYAYTYYFGSKLWFNRNGEFSIKGT